MNKTLEYALKYAELGWYIFPCGNRTKTPYPGTHGCLEATNNPDIIRAWWERWKDANIGIRCGIESGIYIVDIDEKTGGWESLADFEKDGKILPKTVKQTSPGGGAHYFFKSQKPPKNKNAFRPGIDIRCQNYYVILTPSIHPNGKEYEWEFDPFNNEVSEFPDFMRPELEKIIPIWEQEQPSFDYNKVVSHSLERSQIVERASQYLAECDVAIQGCGGHDKLLWACSAMVWGFALDDMDAYNLLATEYNPKCIPPWNLNDPKDLKDFRRKIQEAKKGNQHQRGWLIQDSLNFSKYDINLGNNIRKALLGNNDKPKECPKETVSQVLPSIVKDDDDDMSFILSPTGLVGDVFKWILNTSRKPQPMLALGAALSFCGSIFGRKVKDEWDLRTNIYVMGVAESCAGKEHARRQIKRLIEASGVRDKLLGGEDVTSDAAIESAIEQRPSILFLWDEVGHMMSSIKNSVSSSPHLSKIVPTLMKLYSTSNSTYIGKEYANQDRKDVVQPCVCIYGTTVPDILYQSISSSELRDGWLGRVLLFISEDDPEQMDDQAKNMSIPKDVISRTQAWVTKKPSAPAGTPDIEAALNVWQDTVPTNSEAQKVFLEFRKKFNKIRMEAKKKADGTDCLWGRAEENARKIALIIACGNNFDNAEITFNEANYACKLVMFLVSKFYNAVESNVSDNRCEADKKKMLRIISASHDTGLKKSELVNRTQGFSKKQRDDYLYDLMEAGHVVVINDAEGKAGRPVQKILSAKYFQGVVS